MSIEIILEIFVFKVLLTQQYAARSARGEKVQENLLVLGFRLGDRLVKSPFEPILGGTGVQQ